MKAVMKQSYRETGDNVKRAHERLETACEESSHTERLEMTLGKQTYREIGFGNSM